YEIVNLIETDLLRAQFFPDRIESFDTPFHAHKRHFRFRHLLFYPRGNCGEKGFVFRTPFFELFRELAIVFGMKMTEREVLEFAAQLTHSESMCNRREDLH